MQHFQIATDHGAHSRAQHLNDYLAAVGQCGHMHLRNGCSRQWLLFEAAEEFVAGFAEAALDGGARFTPGKRRHPVLQLRQLVGNVRRQQIAPRRQSLAELHEDGSQFLQRQTQLHRAIVAAATLEPSPG